MMALDRVSKILNGQLIGESVDFSSVSINTRTLQAGDLYVAIQGDHFDGHEFIDQAVASGATAAIVHKPVITQLPVIKVEDTRKALAQLATAWRQKFNGKVVAITGSNGKTTVKEMVAAIAAKQGDVIATQGNFNNDIGLPLTLLKMQQEDIAVIEMGANHKGEIANLTNVTRPDVALINNAAQAHLEGFGSLEGVAQAKGEIFEGLSATGIAVINKDDAFCVYWCELATDKKIITFSMQDKTADVYGEWESTDEGGCLTVIYQGTEINIHLNLYGLHNAMNALAAISVAYALNIKSEHIVSALNVFIAVKGRLNFHQVNKNFTLIDDTYNANPDSLLAAINVLKKLSGEHWLVLGDMGELNNTQQVHIDAGKQAKSAGISRLLTLGEASQYAVDAFGCNAKNFKTKEALVKYIYQNQAENLKILIKGSRFMQMEQVVNLLLKDKN